MALRLYVIKNKASGDARLVKAAHQAQAIRHVAEDTLTCEVAGSLEVADMVAAGIKVEVAATEGKAQAALPLAGAA